MNDHTLTVDNLTAKICHDIVADNIVEKTAACLTILKLRVVASIANALDNGAFFTTVDIEPKEVLPHTIKASWQLVEWLKSRGFKVEVVGSVNQVPTDIRIHWTVCEEEEGFFTTSK